MHIIVLSCAYAFSSVLAALFSVQIYQAHVEFLYSKASVPPVSVLTAKLIKGGLIPASRGYEVLSLEPTPWNNSCYAILS